MKKLILLVLTALACAGFAATASADVVPTGFDIEQVAALQVLGFETPSWLVGEANFRPTPVPHPDFPLTCSDYNSSWCSYQYDGGCCCVGTPIVSGAFCQNYCV